MALTRSLQGTSNNGSTDGTVSHNGTLDCGTVTNGGVLIVSAGGTTYNSSLGTPPGTPNLPTKNSGTATIGTAVLITSAGSGPATAHVSAWEIPITGSGTLILDTTDNGDTYGYAYTALMYTGQDPTTAIAGAVAQTSGAANLSNSTLGATPAADDETVYVVNWDTDPGAVGVAAGTNFTSRSDQGSGSGQYIQMQTATRAGSVSTSTTVVYGTQDGTPAVFTGAGIAFIVKAAATDPTGTMAVTQDAQTMTATGTYTPPPVTAIAGLWNSGRRRI